MAYDIFISYRRQGGAEKARPLKSELERRGYRVFLDFDELKDGVFDQRIMNAIDEAPIFLIILSANSLDRCCNDDDWVRKEIEYAVEKKKHFVPINPNKEFNGFPANVPENVKAGLGLHQFSHIDFEQLFMASIDKMVSERIEPIIKKSSTPLQGALVRIEADLDCKVLRFGKEITTAKEGQITEIRLPKGKHKLLFMSVVANFIQEEKFITINDIEFEEYIEVKLLDKFNDGILPSSEVEQRENIKGGATPPPTKEQLLEWYNAGVEEKVRQQKSRFFCNINKYMKYFRKAAEGGYAEAQYELGEYYFNSQSSFREIGGMLLNAEAEKWYEKAANQGHPLAQYKLGVYYYKYDNRWPDRTINLLSKASENGITEANTYLGHIFYQGKDVERDYKLAYKYYNKAAEKGHKEAQYWLGLCYAQGDGVKQNYKIAVTWFQKAAEQGLSEAQYMLGVFYECGSGVEENRDRARFWYNKAAEQENKEAIDALKKLNESLFKRIFG